MKKNNKSKEVRFSKGIKSQEIEKMKEGHKRGHTRQQERQVDKQTRTTGSKSEVCIRRQTKVQYLVVIAFDYCANASKRTINSIIS